MNGQGFWHAVWNALVGNATAQYWFAEGGYWGGALTEVEQGKGGSKIDLVPCVQYTLKCQRCGAQVKAWVPRYMLSAPIVLDCSATRHLVRIVATVYKKPESSE